MRLVGTSLPQHCWGSQGSRGSGSTSLWVLPWEKGPTGAAGVGATLLQLPSCKCPPWLPRDRFRTMINVLGDALAAGIMAHICRKDFAQDMGTGTEVRAEPPSQPGCPKPLEGRARVGWARHQVSPLHLGSLWPVLLCLCTLVSSSGMGVINSPDSWLLSTCHGQQ